MDEEAHLALFGNFHNYYRGQVIGDPALRGFCVQCIIHNPLYAHDHDDGWKVLDELLHADNVSGESRAFQVATAALILAEAACAVAVVHVPNGDCAPGRLQQRN